MISLAHNHTHRLNQQLIRNFFSLVEGVRVFQENKKKNTTFPYLCETTTMRGGMFPAYLNFLDWRLHTHTHVNHKWLVLDEIVDDDNN